MPETNEVVYTWVGNRTTCMRDLTDSRWIKLKGLLFLALGLLAAGLLLLDRPGLKDAALLGIAIWCFCRFYYFAFYVLERYVDPSFKFSGLWSLASYLVKHRRETELRPSDNRPDR